MATRGKGAAGLALDVEGNIVFSSWEEYPFASTAEGGSGAYVEPVPLRENWLQGGWLLGGVKVMNIAPGDRFRVYVLLDRCGATRLFMTEIASLIRSIFDFHTAARRKIARYVRKPLNSEAIARLVERLDTPMPSEWYELYGAFDGVDSGDALPFHVGGIFLEWTWESSSTVADLRQSGREYRSQAETRDVRLGLSTKRGHHLSLATDGTVQKTFPLVCSRPGSNDRSLAFDSILGMLRSVDEAQQAGKVVVGHRGELSFDYSDIATIVMKHNAMSTYWSRYV